jgi:hypothetical protein
MLAKKPVKYFFSLKTVKNEEKRNKIERERERDLFVNVVFEIGEDVRIVGIDGNQLLHCV